MIDKLEVGVKYKLVDKDGYIGADSRNERYINDYLTKDGCFTLDCIDCDGDGLIDDKIIIGLYNNELKFFDIYKGTSYSEYRVIRKTSKHQVCDWRKGEKLYEDEYGTLVRNEKRTKFYTDTVEWREVEALEKPEPNPDGNLHG